MSDLRNSVIRGPLRDYFVLICYPCAICPAQIPLFNQKGAYFQTDEMMPVSHDPRVRCTWAFPPRVAGARTLGIHSSINQKLALSSRRLITPWKSHNPVYMPATLVLKRDCASRVRSIFSRRLSFVLAQGLPNPFSCDPVTTSFVLKQACHLRGHFSRVRIIPVNHDRSRIYGLTQPLVLLPGSLLKTSESVELLKSSCAQLAELLRGFIRRIV